MPMPGPFELIIILVIILLVFGVGKLPEVGGALGKGIKEFKKSASVESETQKTTVKESLEGPDRTTTVERTIERPVAEERVERPVEDRPATKV